MKMTQRGNQAMTILEQMAHDLDLCDLGMALTTGKRRRVFVNQRKAIFEELKRMNDADGLRNMTLDEIFDELCL